MVPPKARGPHAPRAAEPDLPPQLDDHRGLAPRSDLIGVLIAGLAGDVSGAHGRVAESRVDAASVGRLDLTGAALSDVAVTDLRAVELTGRDGTWRNVEVAGGRIGTLDGLRASWDGVILRGLRIDYLSLASAELRDVLIADCEIGTLDVPDGRLTRVRFEGSRADEVDTRGLRAADLDLRGLEALAFTDAKALAGCWIDARQAETHAVAFARDLGIRVAD